MSHQVAGNFVYSDELPLTSDERFVAVLPAEIGSTDELFDELSRVLKFPEYFGKNWDALSDCLRDFHWIVERKIFLVHRQLPAVSSPAQRTYLRVLQDACFDWRPDEDHSLTVVFPVSAANNSVL